MSAVSELRTQRRFLADPEHKHVHQTPRLPGEACAVQRVTSLGKVDGLGPVAVNLMVLVLGAVSGSVIGWNDGWNGRPLPSREEVLAKLDEAIALAKERGL